MNIKMDKSTFHIAFGFTEELLMAHKSQRRGELCRGEIVVWKVFWRQRHYDLGLFYSCHTDVKKMQSWSPATALVLSQAFWQGICKAANPLCPFSFCLFHYRYCWKSSMWLKTFAQCSPENFSDEIIPVRIESNEKTSNKFTLNFRKHSPTLKYKIKYLMAIIPGEINSSHIFNSCSFKCWKKKK